MTDSSAGSAAPVAMTCGLMPETFLRTLSAPSIRGWMFDCAGRGDEQRDVARRDETLDPLAHLLRRTRRGPGRCRPAASCSARPRCRRATGILAFSAASVGWLNAFLSTRQTAIPSRAAGDRGVERVDHLVDVRVLRAGPLVAAARAACRRPRRRSVVGTKNGFVVTWLTSTNLSCSSALEDAAGGRAALPPCSTPACCRRRRTRRSSCSPAPAAPPVSAVRRVIAASRERGVSSSLASLPFEALEGLVDGIQFRHFPPPLGACLRRHCYRSQKAVSTLSMRVASSAAVCSRCDVHGSLAAGRH